MKTDKSLRTLIFSLVLCPILSFSTLVAQVQSPDIDWIDTPSWEDQICASLSFLAQEAEGYYYNTGICVYDLTADSHLFGYNEYRMMRPASTQKMLTAVSALDILGPDHQYRTSLCASGDVVTDSLGRKVLDGDLYVVGDFDPEIDKDDIKAMAEAVRRAGIVSVRGRVLADVSMKDTLILGNGWCWDDSQPFLTPLSLSGSDYQCRNYKNNLSRPELRFCEELVSQLSRQHVSVSGSPAVGRGICSGSAGIRQLYAVSHPLSHFLPQMMKKSDNLYAESMFFQLGAEVKRGAGWKESASQVEKVVERAGESLSFMVVADGSGLSLYNYVTPMTEVAMLRYAYRNKTIFSALYASLPIAGVDGTLASRMKSGRACNNVRAKTGTVSGVSCLTGYATASNGHMLAFSIMSNGVRSASEGRAFQDRVCEALVQK